MDKQLLNLKSYHAKTFTIASDLRRAVVNAVNFRVLLNAGNLTENLLAPQEGLCFMELGTCIHSKLHQVQVNWMLHQIQEK